MRFATKAIHSGQEPDPETGAVVPPIYQTSTYAQQGIGQNKGYDYARTKNPTRDRLEANLAALEEGQFGLCFSSGMAATTTVLHLLTASDHVLASDDLYGGTHRVLTQVLQRSWGLACDFVNTSELAAVRAAWRPETKLVWLETPTNPLLKITDIAAVAALARSRGALCCVDNTFSSPYFQRPLTLGADLVMHSTTKYLAGHSDLVGGAVLTSNTEVYERLKFLQNAMGAVPGPFDCWLTLRSVKTLAVRMEAHQRGALRIVEALRKHPAVEKVYYPGLPEHPGHDIARRQMSGFGGMVSIVVRGDFEATKRVAAAVRLFALGESLGGVESLVCHPVTMTHGAIPKAHRDRIGITDNLLRLSVGIEDPEDLVDDLTQALNAAYTSSVSGVK